MRTWSVRGTAFALCTRSSSLSMRTSTSMSRRILLLRADGSAGPTAREELGEATRDGLGDELVHLAAERGDLLHAARRHEAVLRAGHDVDGLDVRREGPVQVVHLELPLEVRDHAQALHHRPGAPAPRELDDELREDVDLDVRRLREGTAQELD